MNNLAFSLNATVPIFLLILLGWFLKKINILDDRFVDINNKAVFNIFLPVLLFRDISKMQVTKYFDFKFCAVCFLMTVITSLLITWGAVKLIKDKHMTGSFIQGAYRSSAAILGVAIAENLYGNSGMVPMMIISAVPFYNFYAVIVLTMSSSDTLDKKVDMKKLILGIVKNPIILAIIVSLPFSVFNSLVPDFHISAGGIDFLAMIEKCINNISSLASPLALLVVGAGFDVSGSFKTKLKPCLCASFIKLILLPAVCLPIAVFLGIRDQQLIAILIMLGSPSTVSGYIMARNMKNDCELASGVVVITTFFAAFSITFFIYILRSFSLV